MLILSKYRRYLQEFQSARLRRDHADLAAKPEYQAVGEFFFSEMYGSRDFSARDAGARRLRHFIHLAPGLQVRDVDEAVELMDLTYHLDDHLTQLMLDQHIPLPFDEPTYEQMYYEANNYGLRLRQLDLVQLTLENVHRIAHIPFMGLTLNRTRSIASLMGMEALHTFLVLGYNALHLMPSVEPFSQELYRRELRRLDRIYRK